MLKVYREIGTCENGLINERGKGVAISPGDIVRFPPPVEGFTFKTTTSRLGIVVWVSATYVTTGSEERCDVGIIWSGAERRVETASNDNTDSYKFSHPLVA